MKDCNLITHRDYSIEPIGDKPAGRILCEGVKAIEKARIRYWLTAGTLLGIYRDGGLIKEDTDLDIDVVKADPGVVEKAMKRAGFELIRSLDCQGVPQQRAFIKNDVIFDIYFYQLQNGAYINFNEHGWIHKPAEMFSRLRIIDFGGEKYKCPDPIPYLKWHYGNWEIPNRNSDDWSGMKRNHEDNIDLRNI